MLVMATGTTLTAFCVTMGLAVPAAWHVLGANIEVDGKQLQPRQHAFVANGTRVTLDVDRALVRTGDSITATLVAYSDTPKRVAVDVRLAQTLLQPGERVEPPTRQVDREEVTLDAAPGGGKPARVRLVLGSTSEAAGNTDRFLVYVAPHGDKPPKANESDKDDHTLDWDAGVQAGTAASTAVLAWSGDSLAMKIAAEGPVVTGQPFVIAVRVKNTTGVKLPYPARVELASADLLDGIGVDPATQGSDYQAPFTADEIDAKGQPVSADSADGDEHPVALGAVQTLRYRITPAANAPDLTIAFSATAYNNDIGPTLGGARDVITFHAQPAPDILFQAAAQPAAAAADQKIAAK